MAIYSWKIEKLTPLTIGTNNFLTSSIARSILAMARFSVSSTVINTCNLSFKCSQFGLPRFCSSYLYWLIDWIMTIEISNKKKTSNLFLVTHRTTTTDHNFTASFLFQLFGSHTTWSKNSSNKIELIKLQKFNRMKVKRTKQNKKNDLHLDVHQQAHKLFPFYLQ